MAQTEKTSSSRKSQKPRARVKDLTASKEGAGRIKGGTLPGQRKYPNIVLKSG